MRELPGLALAGLIALSAAAPLAAAPAPVTTFTLKNGLRGVVIENHRSPVAVNMVWYRVGAADEKPGVSGIAHFVEHLMFKGTDKLKPGEFSARVAAVGGRDNAFTSWDYTAYFQRVAAKRLRMVMGMEADRMRHLRLTAPEVATERKVILEERSMRVDSNPDALFSEQIRAAQFMNSHYGIPVIGWRSEIARLDRAEALAWYHTYYAPNNAVLVVAGDVDPAKVEAMARATFGKLAPTPDLPRRVRPAEPPQLAPRHLVMRDARVGDPYLMRSYLAPPRRPGEQKRAAALAVLAAILGGDSATSVLGRKLEFDKPVATYTGAGYDGLAAGETTFRLVVVPAPGESLKKAEAALDAALAAFLETGVDPKDLERIKTEVRAAQIYGRDNMQGQASRYGAALSVGLGVKDVEDWPKTLESVTAADVMAAARAVLVPDNSVTGYLERPAGAAAPTSPRGAAPRPALGAATKELH